MEPERELFREWLRLQKEFGRGSMEELRFRASHDDHRFQRYCRISEFAWHLVKVAEIKDDCHED